MRLINCTTLQFEEFFGKLIPRYAVLSHTWEKHEISYKDYYGVDELKLKPGAQKIFKTCDIATQNGYNYVWIDTCCIDKSSSAELTEAINSMFKWYRRAARCIVYLSDLDSAALSPDLSADFGRCRWFTRGWTLQELIAPRDVHFYDANWRHYGRKRELAPLIAQITGISAIVLSSGRFVPDSYSVAERMSWAALRETTREEDLAYCLFGIFGVNIPLIYGEGSKAFMRLQEEIVKKTTDLTIFAWKAQNIDKTQTETRRLRGIFARSPSEFAQGSGILSWPRLNPEFAVTNRGLRIETRLIKPRPKDNQGRDISVFMSLSCRRSCMSTSMHMGIWLKNDLGHYFRARADELPVIDELDKHSKENTRLLYIVRDVDEDEEEDDKS
ncbi:hypothetical protein N0V90_008267 [Kalmusia sp. IMI 367209]|nr:hypothetical protein N0V90_008267 [Kalmusia sp. IMI 367209]